MASYLPVIFSCGQFDSHINFADPVRYPEGSITLPRTSRAYEIELHSKADGFAYINQQKYERKRGSLLICGPGDERHSTLHFEAIFLHFECGDPELQKLLQSIHGFHTDTQYEVLAPALLDICKTALSFAPNDNILAAGKLIQFLCDITKNYMPITNDSRNSASLARVSKAVYYMQKNYHLPLTVKNIAESCGFSPSYFHRIFRNTFKTTPNNYLLQIRIMHAKSLLASTNIPISEVAIKCGFNSQAYFSDCFKRQLNMSPREFRHSFLYPDAMEVQPDIQKR